MKGLEKDIRSIVMELIDDAGSMQLRRYRNDAEKERLLDEFSNWIERVSTAIRIIGVSPEYSCLELTPLKAEVNNARSRMGDVISVLRSLDGIEALLRRTMDAWQIVKSDRDDEGVKRVFLVHGRSTLGLDEVELFCRQRLSAQVVVLKDQPHRGATIIEKLERDFCKETDVCLIILTADDVGRLKDETESMPRARQNVILELGYAMGLIGRQRVVVLCDPTVELPSDLAGVGYIAYRDNGNNGDWKLGLLGELESLGLL